MCLLTITCSPEPSYPIIRFVPCASQGELRGLLDALHRDVRLDALYPITSGQVSDLKAAVIVQVFRHDPQEEIAVACHQVALEHLRRLPDHFGEAGNALVDLGMLNLLLWLWPTGDSGMLALYNTVALLSANANSYFWNTMWTFR